MSYLGSSQYIKVISPENSQNLKPTSVSCLMNTKAKQTNKPTNQCPISFNDTPRDTNCDVFFENIPIPKSTHAVRLLALGMPYNSQSSMIFCLFLLPTQAFIFFSHRFIQEPQTGPASLTLPLQYALSPQKSQLLKRHLILLVSVQKP